MVAAQQSSALMIPPRSGTVVDMPPLPAFHRTLGFCWGGGGVLKLIVSQAHGKGDGSSKRKARNYPAELSGVNRKSRDKIPAVFRMFSVPTSCRWDACKFLHASPPKDSSYPVAFRDGGGGGPAAPGIGS